MNVAVVGLILLAFGLFLLEVSVTRHGFLTFAGIVSLVLADLILVGSPLVGHPAFGVSLAWVGATALVAGFLATIVVLTHRGAPQTGDSALAGEEALADEDFAQVGDGYEGLVRTRGELWKAVSRAPVARGNHVIIQSRHELMLTVCPVNGLAGVGATT